MDSPESPRLLARVRERIRLKHYSIRTEQAYVEWIRRFILFHGKRHPEALGASEVEAFLTDLAVTRHVAAQTQNQAKSALLFLYKRCSTSSCLGSIRSKARKRLSVCRSF
jgi:hypothetical protein